MNPVSLAERQVEVERFTVSSVLLQCKVITIHHPDLIKKMHWDFFFKELLPGLVL